MTCPRHDELSAYADQAMKPGERARFETWRGEAGFQNVIVAHPRRAYEQLIADLQANPNWLD